MSFVCIISAIPADRLPSVIDLLLWEFEAPANWPNALDAEAAIDALKLHPDASLPPVKRAIAKCRAYLEP